MNKKNLLLVFMVSLFSLALVGCSSEGSLEKNKEKYDEVQVGDNRTGEGGDSTKEVIKKLGKPDEKTRTDIVGFTLEDYIYFDFFGEGISAVISFSNGGVAAKNESDLYREE